MNITRGILALSLLVAGLLASARTSDGAPDTAPLPAASPRVGDARAGKATFDAYCSVCHGVGAKGFIGPNIGGVDWTTAGLHAIVRGGVGGYGSMPAFNADAVTDANIADIAAYLAALPGAAPPAASAPTPSATTPSATTPPAPVTAVAASSPSVTVASGDPIRGRQLYTANCAACHGASGQGGVGPNLHGEKARKDTAAAIAWIKHPKLPMPTLYPDPLSEKDVDDVAAFVESL